MKQINNIVSADYHCHTGYFACAKPEMIPENIFSVLKECGINHLGLAEHLFPRDIADNNNWNFPEIMKTIRREFQRQCPNEINVYFGVEACLLNSKGELAGQTDGLLDEIAPEYVLAGAHHLHLPWVESEFVGNWKAFLKDQHNALIKACENSICSAIAHPWAIPLEIMTGLNLPSIEDFSVIPRSMVKELGRASAETGTGLEVNADCLRRGRYENLTDDQWMQLIRSYRDLLQILLESGAKVFSGSDAHWVDALKEPAKLWQVLDIEVPAQQRWNPELGEVQ